MSKMSDRAARPVGLYPHARRVGNLLYLSGIGSRTRDTNAIPGLVQDDDGNIVEYDIEAEARACFDNLRYVLEDCGSKWENLVDVLVFLTNMKDDFTTYNKIWAEYFGDVMPARTTIEVKSLPTPIAIEVKAVATIDRDSTPS
jgi:2-aminomuconate deaminase